MLAEVPLGVDLLRQSVGDPRLEGFQIDEAIQGTVRGLKRQPQFLTALEVQGINPEDLWSLEDWDASFQVGEAAYRANYHRELNRGYAIERVDVERIENDSTNKGRFHTANNDIGGTFYLGSAEVMVGPNPPSTGMEALVAMTDAFPELGLAWK